jgi:hypothetical protein
VRFAFDESDLRFVFDLFQMLAQGGSIVSAILLILVLGAVLLSLKMSGSRIVQMKVCRNRSIFLSFILLIVIYFMCYTSLWMQVQEFKGSFEKRIKSYSDHSYSWGIWSGSLFYFFICIFFSCYLCVKCEFFNLLINLFSCMFYLEKVFLTAGNYWRFWFQKENNGLKLIC